MKHASLIDWTSGDETREFYVRTAWESALLEIAITDSEVPACLVHYLSVQDLGNQAAPHATGEKVTI